MNLLFTSKITTKKRLRSYSNSLILSLHLSNKIMIQRIQTIYLTLVVASVIAYLNIAFIKVDGLGIKAIQEISLLTVSSITALLAMVCIFLYKKRTLQLKICLVGIVFSTITTTLTMLQYYNYIPKTAAGKSIFIGMVFPLLMIVFFALAQAGIKKDDKLVKSMDRLR
jgi:hypothetical protein